MTKKAKNSWLIDNKDSIKNELKNIVSAEVMNKIEEANRYLLIKKRITYSDLVTSVKYCGTHKNVMPSGYINLYLTEEEIVDNNITYCAKQSNISVDKRLFQFYGIEQLKRRQGKNHKEKNHKHKKINDYVDVFFYNDFSKEFETSKTIDVLNRLNKTTKKVGKVSFEDKELIPIELSHAIHGVGITDNKVFHEIRKNTFWNDLYYFLCLGDELIIIPKRNAKFYSILNEISPLKAQYLNLMEEKSSNLSEKRDGLLYKVLNEEEIDRRFQKEWRDSLAEEMMNYSNKEGYVMCPITGIEVDFEKVGTLFRASHIKGFAECCDNEKFDIDNGLLMVASADALFDKHLFTINSNGEIKHSFYLDDNLLFKLGFSQKIFKPLLTAKRCEYLKYHRNKFNLKEGER